MTMPALQEVRITCPYCFESFEVLFDTSQGAQQTIEDCEVCCRPITLVIDDNGGTQAFSENDVV